jgi:hypothetical protein
MFGVGIGIGVGRHRFAGNFADSYSARVLANGGVIESLTCVAGASALLQTASLLLIPSGYKAGVAYSALPNNGNGDLTWSRNSTATFDATRKQSDGFIGLVGKNVPRLDYTYGSCPALLLEPQRTNLCLQSEDFTTGWSLEGATIFSNTNVAPDGLTTADRLSELAVNDVHRVYRSAVFEITSGTTYTYSIFVLKGTSRYCRLVFNQQSNASVWAAAQFDLDTLTFTSGVGSGGGTFSSATITQLSNSSWIRITLTASLATTTAFAFFALSNGTAISSSDSRGCNSYVGSTSNNVIIWGADFEQGSYATTYIPTTTETATRLADTFTRNNIYTNGLISASGGTWYIELKNNVAYLRDTTNEPLEFSENSNNGFFIRPSSVLSRLLITKRQGGTLTTLFTTTTDNVKIAIKWNGTTADVFVNGVKQVSGTSYVTTLMENLNGRGSIVPIFIQAMALFNSPKSDEFCEALTSENFDTYALMASSLGYNLL